MFVILYSLYLLDVSTLDFFGRIKIRANPLFFYFECEHSKTALGK